MRGELSKSFWWKEVGLAAGGLAAAFIAVAAILVAVFSGVDDPYENVEEFIAESFIVLPSLLGVFGWYLALPMVMIGVLCLAGHPKPWRAPSLVALWMVGPALIWSACHMISKSAVEGDVDCMVEAPKWFSWFIFDLIGNLFNPVVLFLVAAGMCAWRWLEEAQPSASPLVQGD